MKSNPQNGFAWPRRQFSVQCSTNDLSLISVAHTEKLDPVTNTAVTVGSGNRTTQLGLAHSAPANEKARLHKGKVRTRV